MSTTYDVCIAVQQAIDNVFSEVAKNILNQRGIQVNNVKFMTPDCKTCQYARLEDNVEALPIVERIYVCDGKGILLKPRDGHIRCANYSRAVGSDDYIG